MEGTGVILYLTYHALPELLDCSQPASQPARKWLQTATAAATSRLQDYSILKPDH